MDEEMKENISKISFNLGVCIGNLIMTISMITGALYIINETTPLIVNPIKTALILTAILFVVSYIKLEIKQRKDN